MENSVEYAEKFDTWSETYDSYRDVRVLSENASIEGKIIFEPGCGTGRLSFKLPMIYKYLISSDINPNLITHCHQKSHKYFNNQNNKIRFEVQDATSTPYPDNYFDVIIDSWTFCTYKNRKEAAREYKRITNNEGELYSIQERRGSPYQKIVKCITPDLKDRRVKSTVYDDLERLFGTADKEIDIVSNYVFKSINEAIDCFKFNIEKWLGSNLTEKDKDRLCSMLKSYEYNGKIIIPEFSRFTSYSLN